jgi:hypothetical protein
MKQLDSNAPANSGRPITEITTRLVLNMGTIGATYARATRDPEVLTVSVPSILLYPTGEAGMPSARLPRVINALIGTAGGSQSSLCPLSGSFPRKQPTSFYPVRQ